MTDPAAVADPLPLLAGTDRARVRERVARTVQWACANYPTSIASDDLKAAALAEIIVRQVEGVTR